MLCSESDSHFNGELLEKYAVGRLSEGEVASIEEHLLICFECQLQLSAIDEYARVVKAAATELKEHPAPRKRPLTELVFGRSSRAGSLRMPMPMWAAGVAVLAVAVVLPYRQSSPSVAEIALSAPRGANAGFAVHAKTHGKVLLKIDAGSVKASPSYQVQVVNADGLEIWRSVLSPQNNEILALIPTELSTGSYWVRLSTGADLILLQEYSLSVD